MPPTPGEFVQMLSAKYRTLGQLDIELHRRLTADPDVNRPIIWEINVIHQEQQAITALVGSININGPLRPPTDQEVNALRTAIERVTILITQTAATQQLLVAGATLVSIYSASGFHAPFAHS
jgi:hypothetical protein